MKILLMALGGVIVAFGLVDLIGSFTNFDLWGKLEIQLPELLWKYSAYIELLVGYLIFNVGKGFDESNEQESETT